MFSGVKRLCSHGPCIAAKTKQIIYFTFLYRFSLFYTETYKTDVITGFFTSLFLVFSYINAFFEKNESNEGGYPDQIVT